MARANIDAAVRDLKKLYDRSFGGKDMGRLKLDRDQVADLLRIEVAQDKTIALLSEAALNDVDLVFAQCGRGVYCAVAAEKARAWRKVPRSAIKEIIQEEEDDDTVDEPEADEED